MNAIEAFDTFFSPPPAISVSTLSTFSRCPRKFFYSFGIGLAKEEHLALKFGEAIHAAIPQAFFDDLEGSIKSFNLVWKDKPGDDKRNLLQGIKILTQYRDSHTKGRSIYNLIKPPSGTLKNSDQISEYEIPFVLDIGLPVPFVGRIDGLSTHRDTGKLWLVEYKTSSEMSSRFFDSFTFSPQVVGYTLAARAMGIAVEGVIVEALKVSTAKVDAQMTQSAPIYVSDRMIEDFLTWAKWTTLNMLAMAEQKNFIKDLSACTPYSQHGSPGYQCEYMPMCLADDWTSLKQMYSKHEYPTFKLLTPNETSKPLTEVTINGLPSERADSNIP